MKNKLYYNLLEIIEKQDEVICKQKQTIFSLVNENMEKENMISEIEKMEEMMY